MKSVIIPKPSLNEPTSLSVEPVKFGEAGEGQGIETEKVDEGSA